MTQKNNRMTRGAGRLAAACLAAACLLAGCSTRRSDGGEVPTAPRQAQSAVSQVPQADPDEPVTLQIVLPQAKEALGRVLSDMAEQDGNSVKLTLASEGSGYAGAIHTLMEGEAPPDIFWLEGADDAATTFEAADFYDLTGESADAAMRGLAGMVPAKARMLDETRVYGLPLGFYGEGYLVNIEVLAALLGAADTGTLLDDLYACTWRQWETLVRMMEEYLVRPGKIQVKLNRTTYTMAGFRPGVAQPLRGVFAVPTADAQALVGNAVDAAYNSAFDSPAAAAAADNDTKAARLRPALSSMQGLLELETLHMAQKTGPVRRGDNYADQETLSQGQAQELFAEGTALLMRGDSRTALSLESGYPALSGKLALLPVKLPPPGYELEAGTGAEGAESASGSGSSSASEGEEEASANTNVDLEVELAIEQNNSRILYTSDGILCVNAATPHARAAQSLLLRLYTTAAGQSALESEENLYPFSQPYPQSAMMRQVADAVEAGGSVLVMQPSTLSRARLQVGNHVQQKLMTQYEWDDAAGEDFLNSAFSALGLRYTYSPVFVAPPEASAPASSGSSSGSSSPQSGGAGASSSSSSSSSQSSGGGGTGDIPGGLPG